MQIMIDTVADDGAQLYKFGKFLVDNYNQFAPATSAPPVSFDALLNPEPATPPRPPAPTDVTLADDGEADIEIEPDAPVPPAPIGSPSANELDARGMPWDARIHSTNRAKKIDGTWKYKRGVSPDMIGACEAQNKPGNESTQPAAPPATPPSAASPFPLAAPPPPSAPVAPSAVIPPAPPVTVPVPMPSDGIPPVPPTASSAPPTVSAAASPAPTAAAPIDFRGLMSKIQREQAAGKLSDKQVTDALASVGLRPEEMAKLIGNNLLIASVNAALDACLTS